MKKTIKKLAALLLAGALAATAALPAMAAPATSQTIDTNNAASAEGKYTISVADSDTHEYTVYQILTGTLIAGESKLGNPAWGQDAKADSDVNSFIDSLEGKASNTEINAIVKAQLKDGASGLGVVKKGSAMDVVPGYYMIVDTTAKLAEGDAYSLDIVAVFNDITITPKKGTTQSDKKVDDKNDSGTTEDAVVWQDSADYDLGDDVPFRLTATIADDYDNYTKGYKLTFHDTESAGLSFKEDTVEVFVDGTKIDTGYEVITEDIGNETFQVKFANLKDITSVKARSVISVTYQSTLTGANVVYGNPGNPNTSHVTYSNNPNDEQAGENGKTPDDTVVVFVYKLDVDKVDKDLKKLTGAEFTLEKVLADTSKVSIGAVMIGDKETQFEFAGLDDGTYVLTESKTPAGYNTIDPITFTVSATHDVEAAAPKLLTLTATGLEKKDGKDATTNGELGTGIIKTQVINTQGSTLPSTGGMGTTIFYVIGGILVLAAVIVLISKRRVQQ